MYLRKQISVCMLGQGITNFVKGSLKSESSCMHSSPFADFSNNDSKVTIGFITSLAQNDHAVPGLKGHMLQSTSGDRMNEDR